MQDLCTIFLIALGVLYENLEDGLEASTLIGTTATNVKGDETEISKKTLKVGKKQQNQKFSKIRQKSNFGPIVRSHK